MAMKVRIVSATIISPRVKTDIFKQVKDMCGRLLSNVDLVFFKKALNAQCLGGPPMASLAFVRYANRDINQSNRFGPGGYRWAGNACDIIDE
jgi:hypothetical protein